ncbi:Pheromone-regulated membrane protein 5 [Cytospora mali]|uniref:Pheromone-regulated membrane protein 5 n=1 Tax=Cytospora mali TaxID=578113 RepID=A0A194V8Q5_CYTMA|nr:Pheromone-regulated membrane protein 5 [Valsa mali var. pyri (nom. inval.)]
MRRSRLSLKRSLLLSTLFPLSLFTAGVLAAPATTDAATTTDSAATTDATTGTDAMPTESATSTSADESTATSAATTSAATTSAATTSAATTEATSSGSSDMPSLSTSDSSTNSDMPTLSTTSAADTSIPTYPAPTVPPTNAPYMQTSNLPDGTVFICVGAILGAFALALVLWRAIIACLLHRSVERAAMAQHLANDKATFPAPPGPLYKYSDHDSSQNISSGRGVRRTSRGPVLSGTPSQSNLFFSPTAGATNRDSVYRDEPTHTRNPSHRDSRFLPAGFYAAGAGAPQHTDAHGQSISMTNLRPDSRGHALSGQSPPESPAFGPQRTRNNLSTSSVNLHGTTGRAPSAFLDDLLDDHPEMFPPSAATHEPRTHANHPYRQSGGRF